MSNAKNLTLEQYSNAIRRAKEEIAHRTRLAMHEFTEATGLFLTEIEITTLVHNSPEGIDLVLLGGVKLKSNIDTSMGIT